MPSPRWSDGQTAPVAAAIAAAVHEAWGSAGLEVALRRDGERSVDYSRRVRVFRDALRKMVGPEVFDEIETAALRVLMLQPDPPQDYEVAPSWAWFRLCPGCRRMRRTKHTAPQNGKLKLQVLRDRDWLAEALERYGTVAPIATKLGCTTSNVLYFVDKHGLHTHKALRSKELEAGVRRMHEAGEGPGKIAKDLGTSVRTVRDILRRLGLATKKTGQVYFERDWWIERLERRGYTKAKCAREAGMKPHNANYYLDRFRLHHLVDRNRRRAPKYPQLHDRAELRALLDEHGTYQAVAEALGCAPSLVSRQARSLLGLPRRWKPVPHGRRSWWTLRLEHGDTIWEMAAEADIGEKSAREKLRTLGLLTRGYENNARRERAARVGMQAGSEALRSGTDG